jgi:hypothetical protein
MTRSRAIASPVQRCAVRSPTSLGAGLQDDIRSLVRAASELAGWAGVVEFRVAELLPLAEARAAAGQQITA